MTFHVGQKVVCVKRQIASGYGDEAEPAVGLTYTIRAIRDFADGIAGLQLQEIKNPVRLYSDGRRLYSDECSFDARRFRPIADKKSDIAFAHEILRKASRTKETAA